MGITMLGIDGGLVVECTLSCGSGSVVMRFGACTVGSGAETGNGVGIEVGGRGIGADLVNGRSVAWRRVFAIWV